MVRRELIFRVFVSSTFGDLIAERNALQETACPALRRYCQERGARFQAIDLRWGVSEEAALDQQTMTICLEELRRCQTVSPRPNFIVLLGDRYGWRPLPATIEAAEFEALRQHVPGDRKALLDEWYERDDNAVPPEYYVRPRTVHLDAAAREAELREWAQIERSLQETLRQAARASFPDPADPRLPKYEDSATHQEIRHGALQAADAARHVHCYLRHIDGMPESERAQEYRDIKDGKVDVEAQGRLQSLKDQLESLFPDSGEHVYTYGARWNDGGPQSDLHALCDRVERDLRAIIDEELAAFEEIPELDRETEAQQAFGRERQEHFLGREDVLAQIRAYVTGPDNRPLILHGVAGSGKTAVVARAADWMGRGSAPGTTLLTRFVGATPASSELRPLLRSLCQEMALLENDTRPVPTELNDLVRDFRTRLARATAERPMVILLDALDQLGALDGARELHWLPEELPEHVKFIVSVLDAEGPEGGCARTARTRLPDAPSLEIAPLSVGEGDALLRVWLQQARRTLQLEQRRAILAQCAEGGLPLYLKLAFGEARRWKSTLPPPALGRDVPQLVSDLLARLEDERQHGRVLTSRALAGLARARRGLTEEELLGVLSADLAVLEDFEQRSPRSPDVTELPVVVWSRLHAELEPYLTRRRAGATVVMAFYHRQVGEAVAQRYLEKDTGAHVRLAKYFERQPLSERMVDECPWQWARAENWQRLSGMLGDLDFFDAAWRLNQFDVREYWAEIEARSDYRMVDAYAPVLEAPSERVDSIRSLAILLYETGHLEESLRLSEYQVDRYRRAADRDNLQAAIINQGRILWTRGDLDGAMALFKEAEQICRQLGNLDGLQRSLGNQGLILWTRGDLDGAMALHKEQERICRQLGNLDSLQRSLGNQGLILKTRGDLDGAMALYKEQEQICRQLGNLDGLQYSLGNQGLILRTRGDLDGAMALHKEEERICRQLGNLDSLQRSLGNQALILKTRGELDGAAALHKEAERICRQLGNLDGLQRSLGNQGLILRTRGDLDGALAFHKEKERICRQLGNIEGLALSLANQAALLAGQSPQALGLAVEAHRLAITHGLTALAKQIEPAKGAPPLDIPAEPLGWSPVSSAALRAARTAMRADATSTKLAFRAA